MQPLRSQERLQGMEQHSEPLMTVIILAKSGMKWKKMSSQMLPVEKKLCVVAKDLQKTDDKFQSRDSEV
jgi:hypothetical protein